MSALGSSLGSSLMAVSGLEVGTVSTPVEQVCSYLSVNSASCKMAEIARFAALIMDSNTPPKCGVSGGFQYHSTPLFAVVRLICSWCNSATSSRISLSAAVKFDPLSLTIFLGQPLLAVILVNVFMKLPVSREVAITRWHQWVCKQTKRHRYCFVCARPRP